MKIGLSIKLTGFLFCMAFIGCAAKEVPVIRFTDINSRRSYTSIGSPNVMMNGAVNFTDEATGKVITLQSWEAQDDHGRTYTVKPVNNIWTGKTEYKLVENRIQE